MLGLKYGGQPWLDLSPKGRCADRVERGLVPQMMSYNTVKRHLWRWAMAHNLGSSWNRVGDFGVENPTKLGIARRFCILTELVFGMNSGWHEHRNGDGGFGTRIHSLVFVRSR